MLKVDNFSPEKDQVRRGINRLIRDTFRQPAGPEHFLTLPGATPFELANGVERFILRQYPKAMLHFHEKNRRRREGLRSQIALLPVQQRQRVRLHGRDILQGPVGCGSLPVSGAWFDLYGGPTLSAVRKLHRLFEMAAFEDRCVIAITFGVLESRHKGTYVASPREVVDNLLAKARKYHYRLSSRLQEHSYQAKHYQMFSFWWSFKTKN